MRYRTASTPLWHRDALGRISRCVGISWVKAAVRDAHAHRRQVRDMRRSLVSAAGRVIPNELGRTPVPQANHRLVEVKLVPGLGSIE